MKLPAIVVDDIDTEAGRAAGAIELRLALLTDGVAGIAFRCPCGCGSEGYLPIQLNGMDRRGPEWEWDGNPETPTLSPSVFNTGMPCKWHGWLLAGEWVSA
ncbi:hypothetical protein KRZ98_06255 [Sphingobium sp. AS12]|uniref:DUF6527 family protein n=1 Tax=Sphingobium sp. AS12 TaxID=2849495 RepID=UPI001C313F65|nr:DUF6527 family protein [Sphingobium sp. AS12]MBV2147892.1 hypothetical protein [Sphingobium sp. AS12]